MQADITTNRHTNKPKFRLVTTQPSNTGDTQPNPKKRVKRPLIVQAAGLAELTTQTAEAILAATIKRRGRWSELSDGERRIVLRAEKVAIDMSYCGLPDNHAIGADLHKFTAERFEGELLVQDTEYFNGRLTLNCCESPLCLNHIEKKRRKLRKRTVKAFETYQLEPGQGYLFITLTATKMPELTKAAAVHLHNAAFRRWQRTVFYQHNIAGGSRSVETTMRANTAGYHVHSHLPVVLTVDGAKQCSSKFGLYAWRQDCRESWTRAFQAECEAQGYKAPEADTNEKTYLVDCRALYSKDGAKTGSEALRAGLLEAVKYSLKAETIKNLIVNETALLELAGCETRVREFELFGCIKAAAKEALKKKLEEKRAAAVLFLDTGDVTAQLNPHPEQSREEKRRRREQVGRVIALAGLPVELEYKLGQEWEPFMEETLDGLGRLWELEQLREQGRDWRLALGEAWRSVWAVEGCRADGALCISAGLIIEEIKAELWRAYLEPAAKRQGRYDKYLDMTAVEYAKHARFEWAVRQSFAEYRLSRRYPWAEFRKLSGEVFRGVSRAERLNQLATVQAVAVA